MKQQYFSEVNLLTKHTNNSSVSRMNFTLPDTSSDFDGNAYPRASSGFFCFL